MVGCAKEVEMSPEASEEFGRTEQSTVYSKMESSKMQSEGKELYHFDPERIQKIEVRTGEGMRNTLQRGDRTEDAMLKVIESLNQFAYVETEVVEETHLGWYVRLSLVEDDEIQQDVMVSVGAAYDVGADGGSAGDTLYISDDPDYFGDEWYDLLFTDAPVEMESSKMQSEGKELYHFDPDRIQKIEVRTGEGMRNTLQRGDRTEDAMLEVIESLNQFEYVETEVMETDRDGWYVQLNLVDDDGTEQDVMVSIGAAFDIGVSGGHVGDIKYISLDPDYFGDEWYDLLFTDAPVEMD